MAFEYRKGERVLVKCLLDSTSAAIVVGDAITISGATAGYFKEVDAGSEAVTGIAASDSASPSADGDLFVMVDISPQSVYRVGPAAGSVTQALAGRAADVGADARSVDIAASATDDIIILEADVTGNTLLVRLAPTFTGVV